MSDEELLKRLDAILDGMTGNSAFANPPVDMTAFKTAIDAFSTATTEALDGGKRAISLKQKLREAVTRMVTLLAHYVEVACNNDPAVFETSGFVAVLSTRTPAQPLPPAGFDWIDRGPTSGSILVKVRTIPKAGLYE